MHIDETPAKEREEVSHGRFSRRRFLFYLAATGALVATLGPRRSIDRLFRRRTAVPVVPPAFRRFALVRSAAEGERILAYGAQFPDGQCMLEWRDQPDFIHYADLAHVRRLHVVATPTRLVWLN